MFALLLSWLLRNLLEPAHLLTFLSLLLFFFFFNPHYFEKSDLHFLSVALTLQQKVKPLSAGCSFPGGDLWGWRALGLEIDCRFLREREI